MHWHINVSARTTREALFPVMLGVSFVIVIVLLPIPSMQRYSAALLGVWLCLASVIRYVTLPAAPPADMLRSIPLRFSGELGRFELWPRGDGRRVEVRAGSDVVAEAWVTDESDELRLDDSMVADSELEAFGTALGRAIEMVAVADKDRPTDRNVTGPRNWGRS